MASGITNRGKYASLGQNFRAQAVPTAYYAALVKTTVPTVDINTFSELTEVAAGQGYTAGGTALTPGATDFDVWTEDDVNDWAYVQIKDLVWTASGGTLPSDGNGATYMILTDDNVTQSAREVYAFWDLGGARVVSDGQSLTIQDAEWRRA